MAKPFEWKFGMFRPNRRLATDIPGESITRQEFQQECDVNVLMERYNKTGLFPSMVNLTAPAYFDASEVPTDFRDVMDHMLAADAAFMSLPAHVRRDFDNDPVAFVEFAQKVDNLPKMREWGLAAPERVPDPPMRVEVVNPAPGSSGASAPD